MKNITIKRVAYLPNETPGVILDEGVPFALTLERPWRNNDPDVSCIALGVYICNRVLSPKFGDTFQVMNVPGRDHILFHKGNTEADTHGCILVGEQFEPLEQKFAIWHSGPGFSEFLSRLKGINEFELTILAA